MGILCVAQNLPCTDIKGVTHHTQRAGFVTSCARCSIGRAEPRSCMVAVGHREKSAVCIQATMRGVLARRPIDRLLVYGKGDPVATEHRVIPYGSAVVLHLAQSIGKRLARQTFFLFGRLIPNDEFIDSPLRRTGKIVQAPSDHSARRKKGTYARASRQAASNRRIRSLCVGA